MNVEFDGLMAKRKDTGPDLSVEGSFMETDGARQDLSKDSPTSSSQRSTEVSFTYSKRRKILTPTNDGVISNVNGTVDAF